MHATGGKSKTRSTPACSGVEFVYPFIHSLTLDFCFCVFFLCSLLAVLLVLWFDRTSWKSIPKSGTTSFARWSAFRNHEQSRSTQTQAQAQARRRRTRPTRAENVLVQHETLRRLYCSQSRCIGKQRGQKARWVQKLYNSVFACNMCVPLQ